MPDPSTPPLAADVRRLRLGDIEIDPRYRSVHRGNDVQELNPRCFALLMLFVLEPRVLHTREAIFRKVWRGGVVEDASLTTNIWMLRRALGGNARQWLRTVSRQGYIFDPPESLAIELVRADPALPGGESPPANDAFADDADTGSVAMPDTLAPAASEPDSPPVPAAPAPQRPARGWHSAALTAALLVLGLLVIAALWSWRRQAATPRVIVIATAQAELPEQARWPAQLLSAWLDWQLRATPQLAVGAYTGAGAGSAPETVLLISAEQKVDSGDWRVAVHLRGLGQPADIERQASAERLVQAIDEVSRETLAALAGGSAGEAPVLQLPAAQAQELLRALNAEDQRRWNDAAQHYSALLQPQPSLGFAHFRLARCLARLGEHRAAEAELALAGSWIDSLPAALRDATRAEALTIQQQYSAAAQAYAALQAQAQAAQGNPAWRIAQAASLRHAGRSGEAAERLAGPPPAAPALALDWLIERTAVEIANREFRNAAASATLAMQLAEQLGWQREHAVAALLWADANNANGKKTSKDTYTQAARDFGAAGDRQNQLRAQFLAELNESGPGAAQAALDLLLAQARAAGNPDLEIESLRRFALACHEAGDLEQAVQRLTQAAGVAESMRDKTEHANIDLHLIQLDTLRLDFAALDRRLAALRLQPQQGFIAFRVGVNTARLHFMRGQFELSLAALDTAAAALRDASQGRPEAASALDCLRGGTYIAQGRIADAHNAFRGCRSAAVHQGLADVGDAELALYSGNPEEARRLLAPMRDTLLQQPDMSRLRAWGLAMELAAPLARSGDLAGAQQIADAILPHAQAAGHRMIETSLRITRAEIALAQGRVDDAERDISRANTLAPPDYWYERRRIRTVRALLIQAAGQTGAAARALESLHNDARAQGDVLAELLVHSLMDANPNAARCPDERRLRLLAESGMRGASDQWMYPASRRNGQNGTHSRHPGGVPPD